MTNWPNFSRFSAYLPCSFQWRHAAVAALLAVFLQACSSVDLGQANKLAAGGVETASALKSEATAATEDFALTNERISLTFALVGVSGPTVSLEDKKRAEKIVKLMQARVRAIDALVKLYKGYADLISYGAFAETKAAATQFLSATNGFIAKANQFAGAQIPSIPTNIGNVVGVGLGILAEERRKKIITDLNPVILEALRGLYEALEAEKVYAIHLRQLSYTYKSVLRQALLATNIADYQPAAEQMAQLAGYKASPNARQEIKNDPHLKAVVRDYLREQTNVERDDIAKVYNAALGALAELIKQHENLEKTRAVRIDTLLTYAEELKKAYQSKE